MGGIRLLCRRFCTPYRTKDVHIDSSGIEHILHVADNTDAPDDGAYAGYDGNVRMAISG